MTRLAASSSRIAKSPAKQLLLRSPFDFSVSLRHFGEPRHHCFRTSTHLPLTKFTSLDPVVDAEFDRCQMARLLSSAPGRLNDSRSTNVAAPTAHASSPQLWTLISSCRPRSANVWSLTAF